MKKAILLVLLPLLSEGLTSEDDLLTSDLCDSDLQSKYCNAWYGGDYHTACNYCGLGLSCPQGRVSGRKIVDQSIR